MSGAQQTQTKLDEPLWGTERFGPTLADTAGGANREMLPTFTPVAPGTGSAVDHAAARIVTAQRVAIKRDLGRIVREIEQAAAIAANSFYYLWPTKNRDGTRGEVCGPSIDCAMALVNIWGNCSIEAFPAQETPSHWVFMARFVDYEKGVTVTRSFQQRRSQTPGGRIDAARAEDMAFQIGQSKAMRNAVVAGLKMYADLAVQAARASAFSWVSDNIDKARKIVLAEIRQQNLPLDRIERAVGRKAEAWLATDLVGVRAKVQSIADGFDDVNTSFPTAEDDDGVANDDDRQKPSSPLVAPITKAQTARKPRQQQATTETPTGDRPPPPPDEPPPGKTDTTPPVDQASEVGAVEPPPSDDNPPPDGDLPPGDDDDGELKFN